MQQLNYHHLYYFFTIAREGSIVRAAQQLNLTPQTVSGQLSAFENYLDIQLFDRKGKRLVLNDCGRMVFGYAEDIFSLGNELSQSLKDPSHGNQFIFRVGITDVIPKVLAFDILKNAFDVDESIKLVCTEADFETLLGELGLSKLDLVISDRPLTPGARIKAYGHLIGETDLTFFADSGSAKRLKKGFPQSLHQYPFLISGEKSTQKINLMAWFDLLQITPKVVAEFDDSALMKHFGQAGYGAFCAPSIIAKDIVSQHKVKEIGRVSDISERYYAISPERKIINPGVKIMLDAAKKAFRAEP